MATRNCDRCGAAYTRPPSLLGRYCTPACAYAERRKERTGTRRIRRAPGHPLASPSGYVSEARAVLYEKIGAGTHACHWCGTEINWVLGRIGNSPGAIIADHVDSDPLNDAPANIVPACGSCNATRGTKVGDDEAYRVRAGGTRLRGERRSCESCGEDFVAWETRPGKGRFCGRSCARRAQRNGQAGGSTASSKNSEQATT